MVMERSSEPAPPVQAHGDTPGGDFDEFFRLAFPRAVAVAQRVTAERTSAEDAALEALARAHFRWARIGVEPWREAWVLKVAVNEAIRRLPRSPVLPRSDEPRDPADEIALRHALNTALKTLPRRQREVIVLRYLVGLSEVEVAAALHVSHGTVKTHLRRGLSVLRRNVGSNLKEDHLARLA